MHINHRGMSIELEDGDARVRLIETILFGDPLPPPLPRPVEPTPAPPVEPPPPPPPKVPEEVQVFWKRLTPLEQRELVLLSTRTFTPEELEEALGVSQAVLQGTHSRLTRLANNLGAALFIRTTGRSRDDRRYRLHDHGAQLIQMLIAAGLAHAEK